MENQDPTPPLPHWQQARGQLATAVRLRDQPRIDRLRAVYAAARVADAITTLAAKSGPFDPGHVRQLHELLDASQDGGAR